MKRITTIAIGLLGVLIGVGFLLPALVKVRDCGVLPSEVVGFYTLGIVLAIGGISTAIFGLRRRKAA